MQQLVAPRPPQDHHLAYGEYCELQLTAEYKLLVVGANLDWQVAEYVRYSRSAELAGSQAEAEDFDVIATAISVIAERQHGAVVFQTAVENY